MLDDIEAIIIFSEKLKHAAESLHNPVQGLTVAKEAHLKNASRQLAEIRSGLQKDRSTIDKILNSVKYINSLESF